MKNAAITICATKSYTYALTAQARRVQGMILQCPQLNGSTGVIILVGDSSKEMKAAELLYKSLLPEGWTVQRIQGPFTDGLPNYKNAAQLVIARMRSLAFSEARRRNVDICVSLDSDVLPQSNSLEVMIQCIEFSGGYYGVSTCPYPSQGGGDFLSGRGIPQRPIMPDVYEDERNLTPRLRLLLDAHNETGRKLTSTSSKKELNAWKSTQKSLTEEISHCPAKGDIFMLNSRTGVLPYAEAVRKEIAASLPRKSPLTDKILKRLETLTQTWKPTGFRRRGWMSAAYPAIGLGAIVPTDWCGFGATCMGRNALANAQFDGYGGDGTEDLYIVFKKWHRAGIRIGSIPHSPCDHVIRNRNKKGNYILLQSHHDTDPNSECYGHMRIERRPWFQQTDGEIAPRPAR